MKTPQTVMFWRNSRWHIGWVQQRRDDGFFQVAWIEGDRVYTKCVDKVLEVDVPFEYVGNPGNIVLL